MIMLNQKKEKIERNHHSLKFRKKNIINIVKCLAFDNKKEYYSKC